MDETATLTIAQIFEKLVAADDIILDDLPEYQFRLVRRGISSHKTKMNDRLRRNDLPTEDRRVEYQVLETKANGLIKARIFFVGEKQVTARVIEADKGLI